jgi:hypothetical protein
MSSPLDTFSPTLDNGQVKPQNSVGRMVTIRVSMTSTRVGHLNRLDARIFGYTRYTFRYPGSSAFRVAFYVKWDRMLNSYLQPPNFKWKFEPSPA